MKDEISFGSKNDCPANTEDPRYSDSVCYQGFDFAVKTSLLL